MRQSFAVPQSSTLLFQLIAFFVLTAGVGVRQARAQAPPNASFEVASIKEDKTGLLERRNVMIRTLPGGRFEATNVSVQLLIMRAYNVRDFQIIDAPDWIQNTRFDIQAKIPETEHPPTTQELLRSLLADRFSLALRKETRDLPIYTLVWAQSGQHFGTGIRRVPPDCEALLSLAARGVAEGSRDGAVTAGNGRNDPRAPGLNSGCFTQTSIGPGKLSLKGVQLSALVFFLGQETSRVVVDKTGLTGYYDIELEWADVPPDLSSVLV